MVGYNKSIENSEMGVRLCSGCNRDKTVYLK